MTLVTKNKPGFMGPRDKEKLDYLSSDLDPAQIAGSEPTLDLDFSAEGSVPDTVTFTRNSIATYYDNKTVAKAEENLITYSQSDTSKGGFELTITNATSTAPDGSSTAFLLTEDSSGTGGPRFYTTDVSSNSFIAGLYYTFSAYLKAGTTTYGYISLRNSLGNIGAAVFNISTGVVTSTHEYGLFTDVSATIVNVGSGWYRCSVTGLSGQTLTGQNIIGVSDGSVIGGGGYPSQTMTGKTIYVWGLQKEIRTAPTAYTPTTNQPITKYQPVLLTAPANKPRIDHDPITRECKGLLIEESRENLLPYSQDLSQPSWAASRGGITSTAGTIAPDGTLTANIYTENTDTGVHYMLSNFSGSVGETFTVSCYFKKKERRYATLTVADGVGFPTTVFDLVDGVVSEQGTDSASIIDVGNGWYRCSATQEINGAGIVRVQVGCDEDGDSGGYIGDGYSGIFIWGAQVEEGAFPTSYIPTSSSAVTRGADDAIIQKENFSEWYVEDENTFLTDCNLLTLQTANANAFAISVNYSSNYNLFINAFNSSKLAVGNYTNTASISYNPGDEKKRKIIFAYSLLEDNTAFSVNGSSVLSDNDITAATSATLSISIGKRIGNYDYLNGHIRRLTYWPKRLSNEILKRLSIK